MRTRLLAALALVAVLPSCVVAMPPPPRPAATMPDVEEPPEPTDGAARVVFATDVPARVERVAARVPVWRGPFRGTSMEDAPSLLCTDTPCAVTLPYGDHAIVFTGLADRHRTGSTVVHVARPTVVVNHTLGRDHPSAGPAMGVVLAVVGLTLVGIAVGMSADTSAHVDAGTMTALLGAGAGSLALGGIVAAAAPPRHQEGATTQWTPPPVVGPTAGVHF